MEKLKRLKKEINEKELALKEKLLADKKHRELVDGLDIVKNSIKGLGEKVFEVEIKNHQEPVTSIKVENISETPVANQVAITNLDEIVIPEFPKSIAIKKPSWFSFKEISDGIADIIKAIKGKAFDVDLKAYQKKQGAIAVKLVTQDGHSFYNAGGGSGDGSKGIPDNLINTNVHTKKDELRVYSEGHVCLENSTTTPLGANETFTGVWQDTLDYSEIIVTIYANTNSANLGLKVWWSQDGVVVDPDPDVYTITANVSKTFSFPCNRRFVKVTYQNGAVGMATLMLSTLLKRFASKGSSHRLAENLNQEDDAIVTKSMIAGFTTAGGGGIVNVKVNPSGALTTSVGDSVLPVGAATEETLKNILGFQIPYYDEIELTYVVAGNGIGEIETVIYKLNSSILAILTLSYDNNNKLNSVIKSIPN